MLRRVAKDRASRNLYRRLNGPPQHSRAQREVRSNMLAAHPELSPGVENRALQGLVREEGFEPPRVLPRQVLSLLRLPFRHSRRSSQPEHSIATSAR
jgi:hypothetical protein